MFCIKCGTKLPDEAAFCYSCGAQVASSVGNDNNSNNHSNDLKSEQSNQTNTYNSQCQENQGIQSQYNSYTGYNPINYRQQGYSKPSVEQNVVPDSNVGLGMGWYKFLIYFALIAGVVLNVINAIQYFTGKIYGSAEEIDLVYKVFPDLKNVNIIMGGMLLGVAVTGIRARYLLANYKSTGPLYLNILYIENAAANIVYYVLLSCLCPELMEFDIVKDPVISSIIISVVICAVMCAINTVYFSKRKHRFEN